MKMKQIIIAGTLLLSVTSTFAAKYIPYSPTETPRDRISVHLQLAATNEQKAEILAGKVDSGDSNILNHHLSQKQDYKNFSLGLALWYPLYNIKGFTIHGVTFVDHIPGANVQAERINSTNNQVFEYANVKTSRTNFAVGANIFNFFKENWFYQLMIASGVTRYHARADFVSLSSNDNYMDHPGVHSMSPFVAGELGIGKQLNNRSKAYFFVHYAVSRRDEPFFLTGHHEDEAMAKLSIPNNWLKVGFVISRDINI